jgi:hypothetical protein
MLEKKIKHQGKMGKGGTNGRWSLSFHHWSHDLVSHLLVPIDQGEDCDFKIDSSFQNV